MSKFIFILFLFFTAPCFAQQPDSLKSDTLNIPSLNLMLIKQNHHIINKDGKENFYKTWTSDNWPEKYAIIDILYRNQHFFDGCPSQDIIDLFGQPDNYGRYLAKKTVDETDACWIQFIYREDQVSVTLFPCKGF